ncbi:hypothetical protein CARUB_v10007086mg [Capsella rubella]|uniref:Uncharacterized protein n=1 Tax=Capsella rubella TaxID=81985 RepID=R0FA27_9BRAS|nr:serine/arginine repetitive matrix protein 1 [Capsella rubella]EOA18531.1 hypothetical protein CARUB_v10007086mg [Capsella rubella]
MMRNSQPSTPSNDAPPLPKRPCKALLIRAQSPEPARVNSAAREATGSKMKPRENTGERRAPYKALRMRAQSPEPARVKPKDREATGSKKKSREDSTGTRKAPYKALRMRAQPPEPRFTQVKPKKTNTARKAPTPKAGRTIKEQNKEDAREGTMSAEPEAKETVAKKNHKQD